MFRLLACSDTKAQARIAGVGFMLYIAEDDDEKEALKQAETEGTLRMRGRTATATTRSS